jgi:hypothetical protein
VLLLFEREGFLLRKLLVLIALGMVGAGLLVTTGSAAAAGACGVQGPRDGANRFGGIISAHPIAGSSACAVHNTSDPANGGPPLIWWGGPVMANTSSAPLTVTPIYWNPSGGGHPMNSTYKNLVTQYLGGVATASGSNSNVYSVGTEYFGSNGAVGYNIRLGAPIDDTRALPASDCIVQGNDATNIYADGTGYNACLSDTAVTNEIQRLIDAKGLPQNDYSHMYVIFTPKHVESCFYPGSTLTNNGCTINHQPTAAYCAYHSMMGNNWPAFGTIYANMPYPIYSSPVGYTCGSDAGGGTLQSPNHNVDADTEVSPTSHEINEAITDPNVYNGWFDQYGYENGDECAYVYGAMAGKNAQKYNQVINGQKYLTQEEFSNQDFFDTGGGCVPSSAAIG